VYHILSNSSDSECAAYLHIVLNMSISILWGLAVERALLVHVDESWFKFETSISDIRLQTSPNIGTGRSEKSLMHFRAAISAGSCGCGDP
jgi:hypothetical protein